MGRLAKILVTMPEDIAPEAVKGLLRGKDVIRPGVLVKVMVNLGFLFPRKLKLHILEKLFSKYREEAVSTPVLQ
jgi:hypothetical protein